jgi:hypothetical protein
MTKSREIVNNTAEGRMTRTNVAGAVWVCAAQFFLAQVIAQSR